MSETHVINLWRVYYLAIECEKEGGNSGADNGTEGERTAAAAAVAAVASGGVVVASSAWDVVVKISLVPAYLNSVLPSINYIFF